MGERLTCVTGEIMLRDPHLVAFQEVWFEGDADMLERMLGNRFRRIPDASGHEAGGLMKRLTGYRPGGLLSFTRQDVVAGEATFSSFRDAASAWLFWQGDGMAQKGFQSFPVRHEGRTFVVINTHLQAFYTKTASDYLRIREKQFAELVVAVEEQTSKADIIIVGDFNTTRYDFDRRLRPLARHWQDLTAGTCSTNGNPCVTHLPWRKGNPGLWIDYAFLRTATGDTQPARGDTEMIRNRSVDCPYSDHHGLDVQIGVSEPL